MKKLLFLSFSPLFAILLFTACSDDDEPSIISGDITFNQEEVLGIDYAYYQDYGDEKEFFLMDRPINLALLFEAELNEDEELIEQYLDEIRGATLLLINLINPTSLSTPSATYQVMNFDESETANSPNAMVNLTFGFDPETDSGDEELEGISGTLTYDYDQVKSEPQSMIINISLEGGNELRGVYEGDFVNIDAFEQKWIEENAPDARTSTSKMRLSELLLKNR
ncbi:MAG: hypothetical protein LAT68_08430 [Cyclobacteriaceae bacterium]|nr:hypothetical protein [Cyclobacteriaceae bacterium]MCH8516342.1 hypothetical protein [Cyclobacteriaceae bacterium]